MRKEEKLVRGLLKIKGLTINQAYRGRRFATTALKDYKQQLSYLLPKTSLKQGKLRVWYRFGVSSKVSDGDNLIKAFQDSLADFYGFNDSKIYEWCVEKIDVKKGEEYIDFIIEVI